MPRPAEVSSEGRSSENLKFLIEIRHEIEHRSTNRIDDALGAKLQACALNFNDLLKVEFGAQYGLEKRLPLALQFVSFGAEQRALLKSTSGLPKHIEATIDAFEHGLTEEEMRDPAYRMTYGFVPFAAKKVGAADRAVQIVSPDSDEADEIERIIFKDVDRPRHLPSKVVEIVQERGFRGFRMYDHYQLWKAMDARKEGNGYGRAGDRASDWVWSDRWVGEVLRHCEESGDKYR